jgi:hypothetical protein
MSKDAKAAQGKAGKDSPERRQADRDYRSKRNSAATRAPNFKA